MTIWTALILSGYGLHLLWQILRMFRRSRIDPDIRFDRVLPFFIVKLALLAVACSYWIPNLCQSAKALSHGVLLFFAAMTVGELCIVSVTIKENIEPLMASSRFYIAIAAQLLVSVVFPAALLVVVYNLLATSKCGW